MNKITLTAIEQQKVLFLKSLKNNMLKMSISKATISLEEVGNYSTLTVNDIEFNDTCLSDLDHHFQTDLHNFKGIDVDVHDYQQKEYSVKIKAQLIRSLSNFNNTHFIEHFLLEKNTQTYYKRRNKKFEIRLNDSSLGIDFSDFDANLMIKMEQASLNRQLSQDNSVRSKSKSNKI